MASFSATTPLVENRSPTDLKSPFTDEQKSKYNRYVRRCARYLDKTPVSTSLIETAIEWLHLYPMDDDELDIPPQDELFMEFKHALPPTKDIFSDTYFSSPITAISILRDIFIL